MKNHTRIAAVAAVFAAAGMAAADIIPFSIFENSANVPTAGLNLFVEFLPQGSAVDLVFHNQSTVSSNITDIYVEQTAASTLLLSNPQIMPPPPGVAFNSGAIPLNPPNSISPFGGPWQGTLASFGAVSPSGQNGIHPNESLTIRFDLNGTVPALSAAISNGEIRLVHKVQGLQGDESAWAVTVPAPGTAAMLAAGGLLTLRRRRR